MDEMLDKASRVKTEGREGEFLKENREVTEQVMPSLSFI